MLPKIFCRKMLPYHRPGRRPAAQTVLRATKTREEVRRGSKKALEFNTLERF